MALSLIAYRFSTTVYELGTHLGWDVAFCIKQKKNVVGEAITSRNGIGGDLSRAISVSRLQILRVMPDAGGRLQSVPQYLH
ncbi:hypothetical protein [Photobacterium sanctipauli]|uniref:hypothetical protein n=1 Tax=Photobacterium sanctipauli TaxID=1342794 RepID=UPI0011B1D971|nr:hypothetical protein [Photobacterium sanctipauli]